MPEYIVKETGYPGTLSQEVVGELIRCKDCRHWQERGPYQCVKWDYYISNGDFYCGCAEMKEGEADEVD